MRPRVPSGRELLRRGGRLRRGDPAAVGQLGGRRGDPRRRDRAASSTAASCTTSISPASISASRAPRSRPGRRRASRSCPRWGTGARSYPLIAKSADVGFVTPRDAGQAAAIVAEIRPQRRAGRPGARLRRPGGVPRRHRRGGRQPPGPAGRARRATPSPATRPSSPARPRSWPTCCWTGSRRACRVSGCARRVIPDDLEADHPGRWCPSCSAAARSAPAYEAGTLRGLLGLPPPRQPVRHLAEEHTDHAAKQIHLAAHFPGVNNTTVWSDPRSGSHIEFSSFAHLARTAERAKFDFFFLAEGLRLREQNGRIYDLDVVGRPDTFTVLAALAAVTDRLGLAGTINSTFNEPYEVARQFASLDHLSGGRRRVERGDLVGRVHRRELPARRLPAAGDSVRAGPDVPADGLGAVRLLARRRDRRRQGVRRLPGRRRRRPSSPTPTRHFDISGQFNVPRSPQGRPVIFQAGDSDEGREFAASSADAIFSRHGTLADGPGVLRRREGPPGQVRPHAATSCSILPAATFVLGDTDAEAAELARQVRLPAGQRADRDRVPRAAVEPGPVRLRPGRPAARRRPGPGREHHRPRPGQRADVPGPAGDRQRSGGPRRRREKLSIRDLIIEVTGRQIVRRLAGDHGRADQRPGAGGRQRRVHPGAAHHARRAGSVRRHRSCRCCRSGACSGPSTRAPRCAITWAWNR